MQFFIEKIEKAYIISKVLGASSNGRTRDFGSLYHGSNPCAPTKNSTGSAGLIFGRARIGQSNAVAHDQYENTQLEKSQKSQEQDFCRFLLLCIEAPVRIPESKKINFHQVRK